MFKKVFKNESGSVTIEATISLSSFMCASILRKRCKQRK